MSSRAEMAELLAEQLRGTYADLQVARGEVTITVSPRRLIETLTDLRDQYGFDFITDISCTDWPGRTPRIWMAYHLTSWRHTDRLRVKVGLLEDGLTVPSAVPVFAGANWLEREVYDFFGVAFDGHPDLRRILMPDDWTGHPLRKDHPLGGVPVQYKGATIAPPDERGL